ncbi:MAG TPA: endonuclease/exonuclease/phosphatase family protein [Candidatus Saccharimonadales bacterium]|nr:endonuclease/exonuclease/phosphatase family protein [Candidatus Saccharimonadales bacterium]
MAAIPSLPKLLPEHTVATSCPGPDSTELPVSYSEGTRAKAVRVSGSIVRRLALPMLGAAAGASLALHGAEHSADIGDVNVQVTTAFSSGQQGLSASAELQDEKYKHTSLGSITSPDFLDPLPVHVDIRAIAKASTIESTIKDRYDYAIAMKAEALEDAEALADNMKKTAVLGIGGGILAGVVGNELVALAYRRRKHSSTSEIRAIAAGIGSSTLALALLASGSVAGASQVNTEIKLDSTKGLIKAALDSRGKLSDTDFDNDVLNSIFREFQERNACPETIPPTNQPDGSLIVTTYNIKKASSGVDAIADELLATDSHVIFLQEATRETVEALSRRLGMQAVTGWTIDKGSKTYGQAIMSVYPLVNRRLYPLPSEGVEQRAMLTASVLLPDDTQLVAASMHLTKQHMTMEGDRDEPIRVSQAARAAEILKKFDDQGRAVIGGGDINDDPGSETYQQLTVHLHDTMQDHPDVSEAASFPSNGQRIDVILTNAGWPVVGAQRGGGDASDHCLQSVVFDTPANDRAS